MKISPASGQPLYSSNFGRPERNEHAVFPEKESIKSVIKTTWSTNGHVHSSHSSIYATKYLTSMMGKVVGGKFYWPHLPIGMQLVSIPLMNSSAIIRCKD